MLPHYQDSCLSYQSIFLRLIHCDLWSACIITPKAVQNNVTVVIDADDEEDIISKPAVPSLLNKLKKGVVIERDEEIQVTNSQLSCSHTIYIYLIIMMKFE